MSYEIIDFHAHPFLTEGGNFCQYRDGMKMGPAETLADMDDAGISVICGSTLSRDPMSDPDVMVRLNREALRLRDEVFGDRYVPGIHVHPDYPELSIKEVEYFAAKGGRLIGELVPYMCGWAPDISDGLSEILRAVARHGMIVSFHTYGLDGMERIAEAHPDVQFVFAHPGDKDQVMRHVEIMKRLDNVSLDLSGTGIFRYGMIRFLIDQLGAERILFGTDYPLCNLKMYVGGVMGEHLTDRERELIFSGNAKRLLFGKN